MVQYKYDAWGNVITEVIDEAHAGIAELNPFRYRSYYYDTETNLYYLNTRYYDPETGRFISQDDVSYLDPEHINGLNLFAYCGNNPVMGVNYTGCSVFLTMLIISIVAGVIIGGTISGISAYKDGQRKWGLFGAIAGGAIMGGAMGAVLVLGGAAGLAASIAPLGLTIAGFGLSTRATLGISVGIGLVAGLVSYSIENSLRTDCEWTVDGFIMSGISGGVKAMATFGIGYLGGEAGAFDKMLLKPLLKEIGAGNSSLIYGFAKGMLSSAVPSVSRSFLTNIALAIGETFTKMAFISSAAAFTRFIIDLILGT